MRILFLILLILPKILFGEIINLKQFCETLESNISESIKDIDMWKGLLLDQYIENSKTIKGKLSLDYVIKTYDSEWDKMNIYSNVYANLCDE